MGGLNGAVSTQIRPSTLYRCFDEAGNLLYVGRSVDWGNRLSQHRGSKDWWPQVSRVQLEHFPSVSECAVAEARAIGVEMPRYNVHLNYSPAELRDIALAAEDDFSAEKFRTEVLKLVDSWMRAALADPRSTAGIGTSAYVYAIDRKTRGLL